MGNPESKQNEKVEVKFNLKNIMQTNGKNETIVKALDQFFRGQKVGSENAILAKNLRHEVEKILNVKWEQTENVADKILYNVPHTDAWINEKVQRVKTSYGYAYFIPSEKDEKDTELKQAWQTFRKNKTNA